MARTQQTVYNALTASLVSYAAAVGLTIVPANWSVTDYKVLILQTIAAGQVILEQLWDAFKAAIEALIGVTPPQTGAWIQNQMLNVFQYSLTDPQFPAINGTTSFVPAYPAVNKNYQIIKYCSVQPGTLGRTKILVAAQSGGEPFDLGAISGALAAAQGFANLIAAPGLSYVVTSGAADRLFLQMNVWYLGVYGGVIQSTITAAINTYLANIPFDGYFRLSALEEAILAVPGVVDIEFNNVQCRANAVSFVKGVSGVQMVNNFTEDNTKYQMVSGYMILEDTTGYTLTDYSNPNYPPLPAANTYNLNLISQ